MTLSATFCTGRQTEAVAEIQRLRKRIFIDRCGWSLSATEGREVDAFDTDDTVHAGLFENGRLCGTFRATRTDRPYLADTVFPELAVTEPYPRDARIWEISRFGVLGGDEVDLARTTYALMFHFAERRRATSLVAIADLTYERFLRALGVRTRRYGPPRTVGDDAKGRPIVCVAGEIPLALQDTRRLSAFSSLLDRVEIHDAAHVLGRPRVPA